MGPCCAGIDAAVRINQTILSIVLSIDSVHR